MRIIMTFFTRVEYLSVTRRRYYSIRTRVHSIQSVWPLLFSFGRAHHKKEEGREGRSPNTPMTTLNGSEKEWNGKGNGKGNGGGSNS